MALNVGFNDGEVMGGGAAKVGFGGAGECSFSFLGRFASFSGFSELLKFGFRRMQLHITHMPNIRKKTKIKVRSAVSGHQAWVHTYIHFFVHPSRS